MHDISPATDVRRVQHMDTRTNYCSVSETEFAKQF